MKVCIKSSTFCYSTYMFPYRDQTAALPIWDHTIEISNESYLAQSP